MFTRYEYDADGRVVASVAEREPEWSRVDVEALIAFVEMGRVGPHGQPMSEATSRLADPANPDREWDYAVDAMTDFAARRESEFKRGYQAAYGDDIDWSSIKLIVKKVPLSANS